MPRRYDNHSGGENKGSKLLKLIGLLQTRDVSTKELHKLAMHLSV